MSQRLWCWKTKYFMPLINYLSLFWHSKPQIYSFPCGTCGKSTSPGNCAVMLTTHCSTLKIASTCSKFTGIVYASALKGLKTMPCTNVPVICELCAHATNSKTIPAIWQHNLEIDASKQLVMGIPQGQIPPAMVTPSSHSATHSIKCSPSDQLHSSRWTKSPRSA